MMRVSVLAHHREFYFFTHLRSDLRRNFVSRTLCGTSRAYKYDRGPVEHSGVLQDRSPVAEGGLDDTFEPRARVQEEPPGGDLDAGEEEGHEEEGRQEGRKEEEVVQSLDLARPGDWFDLVGQSPIC